MTKLEGSKEKILEIEYNNRNLIVDVKSQTKAFGQTINLMTIWILGTRERPDTGLINEMKKYIGVVPYDFPPFTDTLPKFVDDVQQIMVAYESIRRIYEGSSVGGVEKPGIINSMMRNFEDMRKVSYELHNENIKLQERINNIQKEINEMTANEEQNKQEYITKYWAKKIENAQTTKEEIKNMEHMAKSNFLGKLGKKALVEDGLHD